MSMDVRERIKLSGFNNLTKVLSFNLYDFCITTTDAQREDYIAYIDEIYNAKKIAAISQTICDIIEANTLNLSMQDYDPVGASTMLLMSDIKGGKWDAKVTENVAPHTAQVSMHLDKSHITAHTYPDASDPQGICSFRVDIDIATCGDIVPLSAINYLFEAFECDVVYVDYVVRGFTRTAEGKKIYIDHYFNSIQDFIRPDILNSFKFRTDLNIGRENIWQTKLMVGDYGAERYLMDKKDVSHPDIENKMKLLHQEMREVYHLN
jgi:S-adenosylmethionine decarboxylase